MATTMWTTLRADGLKPPFSIEKAVLTTAMSFGLGRRTAESVANFNGIDIVTIAYKEANRGVIMFSLL